MKHAIIVVCIAVFAAAGGAAAETITPALVGELHKQLAEGNFQKVISTGMPLYRLFAKGKEDNESIKTFSQNVALISYAARETEKLLPRRSASKDEAEYLDLTEYYNALNNAGRIKEIPAAIGESESEFLNLLQAAFLAESEKRVTSILPEQQIPDCRGYIFAFLILTHDHENINFKELPGYYQSHAMLEAFAAYAAVVKRWDFAAAATMEIGDRSGDESEAVSCYDKAADYFASLNNIAKATSCLKRSIDRFPNSPSSELYQLRIVNLLGDKWKAYGTAAEECKSFLDMFPKSDRLAEIKLKMGNYLYLDKKYDLAIRYFQDLAKDSRMAPMNVQRQFFLAFCYIGKGENDSGLDLLTQIVTKHPEHPLAPRAQFVIAKTHLANQEYAKAQDELQSLLTTYPNSECARQAQDLIQRLSQVRQETTKGAKTVDAGASEHH